MKLLFLRGEVPYDFHPERLRWKFIDDCEDMWTVLAERMSRIMGSGELWYWGAKRRNTIQTSDGVFKDVRMSGDFSNVKFSSVPKPDVIIARGGFAQYDNILKHYPDAFKIYYGAGARIVPQPDMFQDFDLFLTDSTLQVDMIMSWLAGRDKSPRVMIFPKPAAPMFTEMPDVKKEYDVCFPANDQDFKGHAEMFQSLSGSGLSILNIGLDSDKLKNAASNFDLNIEFAGWHRRSKVVELVNKCRVGLVMTHKHRDSTPRVIPEMLACNLPVVVANYTNVSDLHINYLTGASVKRSKIARTVREMIDDDTKTPREFYMSNLHVDVVAKQFVDTINNFM